MKNKCIREEHLVDYLENRLTGSLFEKVERHLSECDACLDALLIINSMYQEQNLDLLEHVPQKVTDQTVATVLKSKKGPFAETIINKLKMKGSDFKNAIYDLICFPPSKTVYVRGDSETTPSSPVTVKKSLTDSKAEIEIRDKGNKTAAIRVVLIKSHRRGQPVRVTLLENDREISSYPLIDPVVFEGVLFGRYTLLFTSEGVKTGEYRFSIKDSLND